MYLIYYNFVTYVKTKMKKSILIFFLFGATAPSGPGPLHSRGF